MPFSFAIVLYYISWLMIINICTYIYIYIEGILNTCKHQKKLKNIGTRTKNEIPNINIKVIVPYIHRLFDKKGSFNNFLWLLHCKSNKLKHIGSISIISLDIWMYIKSLYFSQFICTQNEIRLQFRFYHKEYNFVHFLFGLCGDLVQWLNSVKTTLI